MVAYNWKAEAGSWQVQDSLGYIKRGYPFLNPLKNLTQTTE